ncbi:MAG: hypothetical protein JXA67_01590, partial [Micromonosporaceae bacterium]|nr:hypothetical protein [Micromonosporaceae bacterium]
MRRKIRHIAMTIVTVLATLPAILMAPAPAQAAAAPTTSPTPASRYFTTNIEAIGCASGYVCAVVPYGDGVYVFKFYTYGTYYLSNWYGTGFVTN